MFVSVLAISLWSLKVFHCIHLLAQVVPAGVQTRRYGLLLQELTSMRMSSRKVSSDNRIHGVPRNTCRAAKVRRMKIHKYLQRVRCATGDPSISPER